MPDTAPTTADYLATDGAVRVIVAGDPIPDGWAPVEPAGKARRGRSDKAATSREDKGE